MRFPEAAILLPALAGVTEAACNANNCLRAVIGSAVPTRHGVADCSAYLAVTVTPAVSTITSTVTVRPTVFTTSVDTRRYTTSQTTTVSTETDVTTVQETQTVSTETDFITVTVDGVLSLKARAVTQKSSTYPAYASPCSAWDKYVSACSCVGVFPTTITAATPVTNTVVTETTTVTSSVLSTTSSTETDIVSATATTLTTNTQTIPVTSTTLATVTSTALPPPPVPVCGTGAVAPFRAHATQHGGSDLTIYANLLTTFSGNVLWYPNTASTSAFVKGRYIWAIDNDGYLKLGGPVNVYGYTYYPYFKTATAGSVWLQMTTADDFDNSAVAVSKVKACVDSITGELHLDAAGRTQILYCGQQLWMSSNLGADVTNTAGCTQMFPITVPEPVTT